MPRLSLLITVFVVSFLVFFVWMLPAELLISRVQAIPAGPGRLQLDQPAGRVWDGSAAWRWQRLRGRLEWSLEWSGFVPGLELDLREAGDRLRVTGWVGAMPGTIAARDLRLKLPVEPITEQLRRGSADGTVTGRIDELTWSGQAITALQGQLGYGGGVVRWGAEGRADVPPLEGELSMSGNAARAEIRGPDGQTLADARVAEGKLRFRVYRAWPALLGESRGGSPDDVVFEVTRPLTGSGGGQQ